MKVFAVVVTYNRLPCLKQVIGALRKQTVGLETIIVINNSSTDGTKEWLATQAELQTLEQPNSGSSGGYHTGVKQAYEQGADWIWMMDDDILPAPDCAEALLRHSAVSECLHPIHIDATGDVQEEERWLDPSSCDVVALFNMSYKNGKKIWYRNTGSFEGMLVSAALVGKIGFPDPRFFIVHDDLAYAYQASKHTNVAVVADAVMQKLPVVRTEAARYRYLYFEYRNLWLLEEYVSRDLSGFLKYRKRRIKRAFLYALYKIKNDAQFKNKATAVRVLYKAYKDYKQKMSGNSFEA